VLWLLFSAAAAVVPHANRPLTDVVVNEVIEWIVCRYACLRADVNEVRLALRNTLLSLRGREGGVALTARCVVFVDEME